MCQIGSASTPKADQAFPLPGPPNPTAPAFATRSATRVPFPTLRRPARQRLQKHVFNGDLGRIEEINVEERLHEALKTPDEGHTLEYD